MCKQLVSFGSIGQYNVRFASDFKQFGWNVCLDDLDPKTGIYQKVMNSVQHS